jgi:pyruvate dehydrogenase E2 component (dihydrolipoamide acetyltransferase)
LYKKKSTDGKNFSITISKKIASDKGIQLNQVKGSGENGRIIKSDIENFKPT